MNKYLDIKNWNRKEHFHFFSQFDNPFFGIVAEIDCTNAYKICKKNQIPFSWYYHHKSIIAINKIEEFRYRIIDNKIIIFDKIHVTTTISRDDNTFAFSFVPFSRQLDEFIKSGKSEVKRIKNSTGLFNLNDNTERLDVIHFSTVPWINFTGISHARNFKNQNSVPKITFGKYFYKNDRIMMPVSVHVHHGLIDAFHVGKYLKLFEKLMNKI